MFKKQKPNSIAKTKNDFELYNFATNNNEKFLLILQEELKGVEKREGEFAAANLFFYKAACNQLAIGWSECFTKTLQEFGFDDLNKKVKLSK